MPVVGKDKTFFMNFVVKNTNPDEAVKLAEYLKMMKIETVKRFKDVIFNPEWGTMDLKYWLPLGKRDFMDFKF